MNPVGRLDVVIYINDDVSLRTPRGNANDLSSGRRDFRVPRRIARFILSLYISLQRSVSTHTRSRGVIDVEREETSMMLPVREYVNSELSGALEPVFIPNVPALVNTDPGGMLASEATGLLSETPLIGHSSAIVMGQGGELTEDMKSSLGNEREKIKTRLRSSRCCSSGLGRGAQAHLLISFFLA